MFTNKSWNGAPVLCANMSAQPPDLKKTETSFNFFAKTMLQRKTLIYGFFKQIFFQTL